MNELDGVYRLPNRSVDFRVTKAFAKTGYFEATLVYVIQKSRFDICMFTEMSRFIHIQLFIIMC